MILLAKYAGATKSFIKRFYRFVVKGDPIAQLPQRALNYEQPLREYTVNSDNTINECEITKGSGEGCGSGVWGVLENNPYNHFKYGLASCDGPEFQWVIGLGHLTEELLELFLTLPKPVFGKRRY